MSLFAGFAQGSFSRAFTPYWSDFFWHLSELDVYEHSSRCLMLFHLFLSLSSGRRWRESVGGASKVFEAERSRTQAIFGHSTLCRSRIYLLGFLGFRLGSSGGKDALPQRAAIDFSNSFFDALTPSIGFSLLPSHSIEMIPR